MKVTNPLTIIAIFAGLAETSATVVLLALPEATQQIFVWYVMGFPVLLVSLFFLVLYLKPQVFYSPSDFPNPDDYMKTLPTILGLKDDVMFLQEKVEVEIDKAQEAGGDKDAIINIHNILASMMDKLDNQLELETPNSIWANSSFDTKSHLTAAKRMIVTFMTGAMKEVEDKHMIAFCNAAPYPRSLMDKALSELIAAGTVLVEPHPTAKDEYRLAPTKSTHPSKFETKLRP